MFHQRGLRDESAIRAAFGQSHALHGGAADAGQIVVRGEAIIHKSEVGGDDGARGQILANHGAEERLRLMGHRIDEIVVFAILGIQSLVRDVATQFAQIEPLFGKGAHELLEARIGDEALGLRMQHGFVMQTAVFRELGQFVIGPRVPEKMRETARDGKLGIGSVFSRFGEVKAMRGAKQCLIAREHRIGKRGSSGHFGLNELQKGLVVLLAHRTQSGHRGESAKELFSIGGTAFRGIHLIKQDMMRWRWPLCLADWTGHFKPLNRDAAMALRRHRRVIIEEAAIGADEGHR